MINNLLKKLKGKGARAQEASVVDAAALLSQSDYSMPEPDLWEPISQACTQAQLEEPHYSHWCAQIGEDARMHRKQWEYCYIMQALHMNDMIKEGRSALGFGVGNEPMAAMLANNGVSVLGTDLAPQEAHNAGWIETEQHALTKQQLNARKLCDPDKFERLVDFRFMDMNNIDRDLGGEFDFCWSACAFEHLGSIAKGLEFVVNSVRCLKPGGIAVHTTEFNCSSNDETVDNTGTVLFRRRDFEWLEHRLKSKGCRMEFNWNLGEKPIDLHIDVPPYRHDDHLKLQIEQFVVTSFGIIIHKD